MGLIRKTRKRLFHTVCSHLTSFNTWHLTCQHACYMHVDLMWPFIVFLCIQWMHSWTATCMWQSLVGKTVTHVKIWGIFAQKGHIISSLGMLPLNVIESFFLPYRMMIHIHHLWNFRHPFKWRISSYLILLCHPGVVVYQVACNTSTASDNRSSEIHTLVTQAWKTLTLTSLLTSVQVVQVQVTWQMRM